MLFLFSIRNHGNSIPTVMLLIYSYDWFHFLSTLTRKSTFIYIIFLARTFYTQEIEFKIELDYSIVLEGGIDEM